MRWVLSAHPLRLRHPHRKVGHAGLGGFLKLENFSSVSCSGVAEMLVWRHCIPSSCRVCAGSH